MKFKYVMVDLIFPVILSEAVGHNQVAGDITSAGFFMITREEGEVVRMKSMEELNKLWRELGDVPVNNRDETEQSFLHFPAETDKFEIWHWFEDQNNNFIVGEMVTS
jgi:hypothetical protein